MPVARERIFRPPIGRPQLLHRSRCRRGGIRTDAEPPNRATENASQLPSRAGRDVTLKLQKCRSRLALDSGPGWECH